MAAQESAKYAGQVKDAAEASAELARRMAAAGNFSKLDQAREQVFYAESAAQLARTRQAALTERERLTQLMGLWGEDIRFTLPERLPDLPDAPREDRGLEALALEQRLDVQAAMQDAQSVASSPRAHARNRFHERARVAYVHNNETGKPRQTGYEIELRLPIFDWGGARVARAEYTYMQAVNRAADVAVRARSEVREAYNAYRTAFDLARHYRDEIVPLRKRISDENVLRYNGMLISVFELLADARPAGGERQRLYRSAARLLDRRSDAAARADRPSPGDDSRMTRTAPTAAKRLRSLTYDETNMTTRRTFCAPRRHAGRSAVSKAAMGAVPEAPIADEPPRRSRRSSRRPAGPISPVVTLNGWTLPVADEQWLEGIPSDRRARVRELAPGMKANLWGYNGQSPGPTIECVEGDKVRIFVTNKLPEHTTVHWHGILLPNGMDGVGGLNQPHIPAGKTFVYEFLMPKSGTFMYHPHADEMVQMAMGMMGFIVVHPKNPRFMPVDRDFVFLINAFLIEPGAYTPKVAEMLDFNLWAWNSRVFPGIDAPAGASRRSRAHPHRQSHDDEPPDPHPRPRLRSDRAPTAAGCRRRRAGRRRPSTWRSARCARSSSSRTTPATGRSIATSRTTS